MRTLFLVATCFSVTAAANCSAPALKPIYELYRAEVAYETDSNNACFAYDNDPEVNTCILDDCFSHRQNLVTQSPDCEFAGRNVNDLAISIFMSAAPCENGSATGDMSSVGDEEVLAPPCEATESGATIVVGFDDYQAAVSAHPGCETTNSSAVLESFDCSGTTLECAEFMSTQFSLLTPCAILNVNQVAKYIYTLAACVGNLSDATSSGTSSSSNGGSEASGTGSSSSESSGKESSSNSGVRSSSSLLHAGLAIVLAVASAML